MRGWVCHLQLLLTLASAVILSSESRGTHDHILILRFETPTTWRARSLYLCPPGTGWPVIPPGAAFPFCHLIWLAGIRNWEPKVKVKVSYFMTGNLPPISSSWHQAPWEPRPEFFFSFELLR
jgi:hypothetical protein